MSCEFRRGRVIDLVRGDGPDAEIAAHLRNCPNCARFFQEQTALNEAMKDLAQCETGRVPPDAESFLIAEFDGARSVRRRYWKPAAALGAIAAAIVCFALLRPVPRHVSVPPPAATAAPEARRAPAMVSVVVPNRKPVKRSVSHTAVKAESDDEAPFVAIPWTLPIDPQERVQVMRVEMPVAALVSVGLAAGAADPTTSAQADVLVSQDGRIRAVRLVSFDKSSDFRSERKTNP